MLLLVLYRLGREERWDYALLTEDMPNLIRVDWFIDEFVHSRAHAFFSEQFGSVSSKSHNVNLEVVDLAQLLNLQSSLEAVHHRHVAVHEDQFVVLSLSRTNTFRLLALLLEAHFYLFKCFFAVHCFI